MRRATTGWMAKPRRRIPTPRTAPRMPDRDGPQKLGDGRRARRRQVRDSEREGAEAGQVVEADEDQRADARGEQPGNQYHAQHGAADPGDLHQEKRGRKRRPEHRADRGEAAGGADHGVACRRRVPLQQVDRQHAEPAADRDQGRLGAQHGTQAERRRRSGGDAGQVARTDRTGRLEPLGRNVPAVSGQIVDCKAHEHAAQREHRHRPPHRLSAEPHILRERREREVLELSDALEEEVGHGRDGDADDRAEDDQGKVLAAPEQLDGIGRCRRTRCSRARDR